MCTFVNMSKTGRNNQGNKSSCQRECLPGPVPSPLEKTTKKKRRQDMPSRGRRYIQYPELDTTAYNTASNMDLPDAIAGGPEPPTPTTPGPQAPSNIPKSDRLIVLDGRVHCVIGTISTLVYHLFFAGVFGGAGVTSAILKSVGLLRLERLVATTFCAGILRWWWAAGWVSCQRGERGRWRPADRGTGARHRMTCCCKITGDVERRKCHGLRCRTSSVRRLRLHLGREANWW
jgi:hypothetical protein